jgi:Helix-turn-helix
MTTRPVDFHMSGDLPAHQKPQTLPRRMSTNPGTTYGIYVRERRLSMKFTQRALTDLTGVSLDVVRHIEQGGTKLQLAKLLLLISALGGELLVIDRNPHHPFVAIGVEGDVPSTGLQMF